MFVFYLWSDLQCQHLPARRYVCGTPFLCLVPHILWVPPKGYLLIAWVWWPLGLCFLVSWIITIEVLSPPGHSTDSRLKHIPNFYARGLYAYLWALTWGVHCWLIISLETYWDITWWGRPVDAIFVLSICPAPGHQYHPQRRVYICLMLWY